MSDIAKWAILVAGMLALLVMAGVLISTVGSYNLPDQISAAIASATYYFGNFFIAARGILNTFAHPVFWDYLLWIVFLFPISMFAIRVTSFIYKWIFK